MRPDEPEFDFGTPARESSSATAVAEMPDPVSVRHSKPVLVTGASGLVGTHTCEELLRAGWKVRALVRNQTKAAMRLGHMAVEFRTGDVRDKESLEKATEGCGAVVHLAAIAIEKAGQKYEDVNTGATKNLLAAARAAGVDRFVHMSQNGSDSRSGSPFIRSKGLAQEAVAASGSADRGFRRREGRAHLS